MHLTENIKEGLRSVRANLLRSVLTALIIAVGITSLVGILTAIDGVQASVNDSLAGLGANAFDIRSIKNRGGRRRGKTQKTAAPIRYRETQRFIDQYNFPSIISLSTNVTFGAEAKYASEKTEPNVWVLGANEDYVPLKNIELTKGRNFAKFENQYGTNVAILGPNVVESLFGSEKEPVGEYLTLLGEKFKIIGVMEEKGGFGGNEPDNSVIVPIIKAKSLAGNRALSYSLSVGIGNPAEMENAMGEATGVMRSIRRDGPGQPDSFEVAKSATLSEELDNITSKLRIGGFAIGFITLLGASIALMNIMMVTVTERTREVGVRKALGATPLRIRQQFIIEAIVVCILGGIMGIALGISIGNLVSIQIGEGGFIVPWFWIVIAIITCVSVGLLSGYYPAYKASKLDPIESLRFE